MKAIAAVDKNWAIGKDGGLLAGIPEDMKFFRETTSGHIVVMGRKTLESFPGKKPLKNRVNIVITRDKSYTPAGEAVTVHNMDELADILSGYDTDDVFVIGGDSIYRLLLPLCNTAYITKIDKEYEADAYFPDLDKEAGWKAQPLSEEKEHEGLRYRFFVYRREQKTSLRMSGN